MQECQHCGQSLKRRKASDHEKRQVFDLPKVEIQVTEHRAEIKVCACCGKQTRAVFPSAISKVVQYGTEIKAQMAYLNTEQHIPLKRTCDLLEEFYRHRPSEGTVMATCAEVAQKVENVNKSVKEHVVNKEEVVHFDETGMMINGTLHWLHTVSTQLLTYYAIHAKRGSVAMNEINILPRFKGRAVHDDLAAYFLDQTLPAVCNAHHLRTLLFLQERYPQKWVQPFSDLLVKIKAKTEAAKAQLPRRSSKPLAWMSELCAIGKSKQANIVSRFTNIWWQTVSVIWNKYKPLKSKQKHSMGRFGWHWPFGFRPAYGWVGS